MNYIDLLLIVISIITGCVSISAYASLFGIPIGIVSSAIRIEICAITAGTKNYKSIIKKKKKKHDKIVLLAKSKLNIMEVLISKSLTLLAPISQNGHTQPIHRQFANKLFECV